MGKKLYIVISIALFGFIAIVHLMKLPLKSKDKRNDNNIIAKKLRELNQWRIDPLLKKLGNVNEVNTEKKTVSVLIDAFKRVDANGDNALDVNELNAWITKNVEEHFKTAMKENVFLFTAIDLDPRNGEISWSEYLRHIFKKRGYDETFIKKQKDSLKGLPRELKENIMRDKASWSEAARDDPARLTLHEFMSFRHPESSHESIALICDRMLVKLDANGDGLLTGEEFSNPETNEVPDNLTANEFKEKRKKLFRDVVDTNGSNFAERIELLKFIDPKNPHHAKEEAEFLISIADADSNSLLSLQEVLAQKNIFIISKMIDVAKSFHDEF